MPFGLGFFATAGAGAAAGAFELISTQVLASSASSVTFSSIPQTYKHLQIRVVARSATTNVFISARLNGDTAANYATHSLFGEGGGSVTSGADAPNRDFALALPYADSSDAASAFGASCIDILDYTNSSKNTTLRGLGGFATRQIRLSSGFWNNTAAVTSVTLFNVNSPLNSSNFGANSRFSLYGIKG